MAEIKAVKKELKLTTEEIATLEKAQIILKGIVNKLDAEEDYLGKGIEYPDILNRIRRTIDTCFYL